MKQDIAQLESARKNIKYYGIGPVYAENKYTYLYCKTHKHKTDRS